MVSNGSLLKYPGGLSHYGLTGGQVGLRVLPNGYQMVLFVKYILPIGGILRLLANYKILSRYVPPHANLVAAAMLINEF